ncbi:MAG TPA: C39 family peptidase [Chloroflexota bacterium]|nr:C39 family peptidase [Chloroflexota bacterium]
MEPKSRATWPRWLGGGLIAGLVGAALVAQAVTARPGAPLAAAPPAPVALAADTASPADAPPALVDVEAADAATGLADAPDATNDTLDAAATAPHPRLAEVPFRTQRDGSPYAGSNCGPATLAMVLEAYGVSEGNDDLRYLTHTYQGTWPRRGGTALQYMAQVGEDFGLHAVGLYDGDAFRQWSVADVRAEVEQGHPVIALVKYRLLPGRSYSTVRYDHYVVLWEDTPNGFIYNDPIYSDADEGFGRFMTDAQLDAAMAPTMEPRQAVAFY